MSIDLRNRILWLVLFSIAMGFLETAVVVYLRELYYPNGFSFPLTVMDQRVGIIELLREAATVIMLLGVGVLAGRSFNQRFAFFLVAFAIWDIFYYVFLKLLIDWPESFFTWDILFLIPVPWIGPVLAPCLICVTMLLLAFVLIYREPAHPNTRLNVREWLLLVAGSLVVVASWASDFLAYSSKSGLAIADATLTSLSTYVPQAYNWHFFSVGELILMAAVFLFWRRTS